MCIKAHTTLIVYLDINLPENNKLGSFYESQAYMWLKDSQLQQSDGFWLAVELIKVYKGTNIKIFFLSNFI